MSESFTFYSSEHSTLPPGQMSVLVEGVPPTVEQAGEKVKYIYAWPDLKIICTEFPGAELAEHLEGFVGYVARIFRGSPESRALRIVDRIKATKLVVGVEVIPGRDPEERTDEVVGKLCGGLQSIMFFEGALYEWDGRLILGPDGSSEVD
jgi:hypothetical protein